jgi:hypothetical protein
LWIYSKETENINRVNTLTLALSPQGRGVKRSVAPPLRGGVGEGVRISTLYIETKYIIKGRGLNE